MYKIILCLFYLCIQINLLAEEMPLLLTHDEQQWLKDHPTINVGIDTNFFPFEFVDENNAFKGISADYLKEMEKNLGVTFTIIKDRTMDKNYQYDIKSTN